MSTPSHSSTDAPKRNSPFDPPGALSLRSLRIIFVAMFFSVVLYALIGTFLSNRFLGTKDQIQQLYRIFSFVGGLCVAGLLLIRNLINRWLIHSESEPGDSPDPAEIQRRVSRTRRLTVVAFALSEAIALLGLVFVFLGGNRSALYIYCAISLACLILFFPREVN
jgi:F0F1-type ATP synthase membrane subunit c/vacuolar-type H+-ATPase subunit K